MAAEREIVDRRALTAQVEDANLEVPAHRSVISHLLSLLHYDKGRSTFDSGTPRLYLDFGYGLFLQ